MPYAGHVPTGPSGAAVALDDADVVGDGVEVVWYSL